jgi:hypothetical protein
LSQVQDLDQVTPGAERHGIEPLGMGEGDDSYPGRADLGVEALVVAFDHERSPP